MAGAERVGFIHITGLIPQPLEYYPREVLQISTGEWAFDVVAWAARATWRLAELHDLLTGFVGGPRDC